MGSLLRRSFYSSVYGIARSHKNSLIIQRLQQTHAALSSINETHEPPTNNNVIPIFRNAIKFGDKTALRDLQGHYTYRGLFLSSRQFAGELSNILKDGQQERIAFLMPNDARYVIVQWACWMSGQVAVPLSVTSPPPVLEYYLKDSGSKVLITTTEFSPALEPIASKCNCRLIVLDDALRMLAMKPLPRLANNKDTSDIEYFDEPTATPLKDEFYNDSDAMFVYTSGTTGTPKAVVLTHKNLQSQMNALINAWKWTEKDIVLHTLPLNHIHGIVNVLMCPLYVGARCVMLPKFETSSVWGQLLAVNLQNPERVNIFMAVPTIYMKLIQEYEQLFSKNPKIREYVHTVCSTKIRLMVSGSAPLPKPIFDRWEEITGHRLLERYGMTETGMVLSNPLEGQRIPGTVGTPLPGVQVRITTSDSSSTPEVLVQGSSSGSKVVGKKAKIPISGDLQVKGESLFREYFNKPEATAKEFTNDKWFKTGDTAMYDGNVYSILGRSSVDIIKTGGYKVSALQVETVILGHPDIIDCAVVGLPDITWGQKVAAVAVTREGSEILLHQLREFAKKSLPDYAVPTVLKIVDKIPKNNLGKVNKPNLLAAVFPNNKI